MPGAAGCLADAGGAGIGRARFPVAAGRTVGFVGTIRVAAGGPATIGGAIVALVGLLRLSE